MPTHVFADGVATHSNHIMSQQLDPNTEILRVENLQVAFPLPQGRLEAVKGVSLRVMPGKVTALVGESGSGKSSLARLSWACSLSLLKLAVKFSSQILKNKAR